MGFTLLGYVLLALSGSWMFYTRQARQRRLLGLPSIHYGIGLILVGLVLLLLAIGLVGTLGHYGSLGHSSHLPAGLVVVGLVLLSAWSATQIRAGQLWARSLHVGTNLILFVALAWVSWTGWTVVQKYLS